MESIFSDKNVQISVENLLCRGNSCGVDGIYVSEFREYWTINKEKILQNVKNGSYIPGIVQEIEILKKNGKRRILSKYNCTDRVLQENSKTTPKCG